MAGDGTPPVRLELAWEGDLRFAGRVGETRVLVDGRGEAGPSPVGALTLGLAGCMAIDVLDILQKGRFEVRGLRARLAGVRRAEAPRRFTRIELHFAVKGAIPPDRVARAIALSRETYCSVWHSLRPDIDLQTSFEVT
jgi:putative redox protein